MADKSSNISGNNEKALKSKSIRELRKKKVNVVIRTDEQFEENIRRAKEKTGIKQTSELIRAGVARLLVTD